MQPDPAHLKRELRHAAIAFRLALSRTRAAACDADIHAHLLGLESVIDARCVFVFVSVGREVDTRPLISHLHANGTRVLVPRVSRGGLMAAVEFDGWASLERGALGIPRPQASEDRSGDVETAIIPALAFTRLGYRLGYGGGYYDRWLALNPAPLRIGVCREQEIHEALPTEPHDARVDVLVTEAGVRRCGACPERFD